MKIVDLFYKQFGFFPFLFSQSPSSRRPRLLLFQSTLGVCSASFLFVDSDVVMAAIGLGDRAFFFLSWWDFETESCSFLFVQATLKRLRIFASFPFVLFSVPPLCRFSRKD